MSFGGDFGTFCVFSTRRHTIKHLFLSKGCLRVFFKFIFQRFLDTQAIPHINWQIPEAFIIL